ncbi:Crp/Fnr family transcriptional regulator [Roseovarius salinarum]|uniref:Crp/Fnr family transcriptional regulator n=1 Tax=Roseovarius salinarum TaxID=1981892 RepID=UPI0018E4C24B|nr:Crp/Fnr family transcriptional regulator [Roseovarius salinarum]
MAPTRTQPEKGPGILRFTARFLGQEDISAHDPLVSAIAGHARHFEAGAEIVREGDSACPVLCVLDGWIAQSKTLENGETQIIDICLPGDIAFTASADGSIALVEVETLSDATVAVFDRRALRRLRSVSEDFIALQARRADRAHARFSERLLRLGRGSAAVRIAYALLEFGLRLGMLPSDRDSEFHLPLTQQRLGEFTGLSSVHVCRTLRRFERDGLIATRDHMDIRLRNPQGLARISQVDLAQLSRTITGATAEPTTPTTPEQRRRAACG